MPKASKTRNGDDVSDSGPIIAFSRVGRLDILERLFGHVIIPNAVYEELVVMGKGRPGADEVSRSAWIQRRTVRDRERIDGFSQSLHKGEREAISLAHELAVPLLIDERRGRRTAADMGVAVIGSLAVLAEGNRAGLVEDMPALVQDILDSGYWIDPEVVETFLVNEKKGGAP